jgi:hypothetical protein
MGISECSRMKPLTDTHIHIYFTHIQTNSSTYSTSSYKIKSLTQESGLEDCHRLVFGRYSVWITAGNIGYPDWGFLSFSSVLPVKCRDRTSFKPRPLYSKSFPVFYSSIVLTSDAIVSIVKSSLYKPQKSV